MDTPVPPRRQRGRLAFVPAGLVLLFLLAFAVAPRCRAQQQYEANKQNDCYGSTNGTSVLGYTCNATASAAAAPCDAFLVYRSAPPDYGSPVSISYLLNSSPDTVADANDVSTFSPVGASRSPASSSRPCAAVMLML